MSIQVPILLVVFILMLPVWLAFWIAYDYAWDRWVAPAMMRRFMARHGWTEADYAHLVNRPTRGNR